MSAKKPKTEDKAHLLFHPIRMRILLALLQRQLTPLQLAENLTDVPQATLYRQLNKLVEAGVAQVVAERPVRGTVEKVYTVPAEKASLSPEDLAQTSREEHLQFFTTFVITLLSDFSRYLQQEKEIDFLQDGVSYTQVPIYLNQEEMIKMSQAFGNTLAPLLANQPAPDRRRYILSSIFMPNDKPESG
jgi:DNA-binding transcriptional ArsR family regulator